MGNCYFENRRHYGTWRISRALAKSGIRIGRCKVRQLMRKETLKAFELSAFEPKTTESKGTTAAPDLASEIKCPECVIGKIIIGDITYIRFCGGKFCYLAVRQDKVTRRITGWSLGLKMTAVLVISALQKAIGNISMKAGANTNYERGSQYASKGFRQLLRKEGFCAKV